MEPINNDYHSDQLLLLPLPLAYRYLVGVNPPTQKRSLWKLFKSVYSKKPSSHISTLPESLSIAKCQRCSFFGAPLYLDRSNDSQNTPIYQSRTSKLLPWNPSNEAFVYDGSLGDRSVRKALLIKQLRLSQHISVCSNHTVHPDDESERLTSENSGNTFQSKNCIDPQDPEECYESLILNQKSSVITRSQSSVSTNDSLTLPSNGIREKNGIKDILVSPVAFKYIRPDSSHLVRRNRRRHPEAYAIYKEALCYRFIHRRLQRKRTVKQQNRDRMVLGSNNFISACPVPELMGFHSNRKHPGQTIIITRLLSGPDLGRLTKWFKESDNCCAQTLLRRLWYCVLILRRVYQIHSLGIRHNDLKPANFVIDLDVTGHFKSTDGHVGVFNCKQSEKGDHCSTNSDVAIPEIAREALCPSLLSSEFFPWTSRHQPYFSLVDIKLIDFGCATPITYGWYSGGTPAYLSPELIQAAYYHQYASIHEFDIRHPKHRHPQIQCQYQSSSTTPKSLAIDHHSDLWSIGIVLIEVLTGRPLTMILKDRTPRLPLYSNEGWIVSPSAWMSQLKRKVIGKSKTVQSIVAQRIFDCYINEDPSLRGSIEDGLSILIDCAIQLKGLHLHHTLQSNRAQIPFWIDDFFMSILC